MAIVILGGLPTSTLLVLPILALRHGRVEAKHQRRRFALIKSDLPARLGSEKMAAAMGFAFSLWSE